MKKILGVLVVLSGFISISNAKMENPKDKLTDKEYFSLRVCDVNKKESEHVVKDCRDAYSIRAINAAEERELDENADQYIFGKSNK